MKVVTARQRSNKQTSAVANKITTIEDVVFPLQPFIANGSINMLPQQRACVCNNIRTMSSMPFMPRLYSEDKWEKLTLTKSKSAVAILES